MTGYDWLAATTTALGFVLVLLALGLMLGGCAGAKPFDYDRPDEIPSGAGLLSGKDGAFTLYRRTENGNHEFLR